MKTSLKDNVDIILENAQKNGLPHHRNFLQIRLYELLAQEDAQGINDLSKLKFTKNKGLKVYTTKYCPEEPTFDDIKMIPGIQKDVNVWTKNEKTGDIGLWVNFDAVLTIAKFGKKISTQDEYLATISSFPRPNQNQQIDDFIKFLGLQSKGLRYCGGPWSQDDKSELWSISEHEKFLDCAKVITFGATKENQDSWAHKNCGFNIRFKE